MVICFALINNKTDSNFWPILFAARRFHCIGKILFFSTLIDRYDEFGRHRSNSLNATVENLILSKKSPTLNKLSNKPRGSVPTLTNIPRKMLIRQNQGNQGGSLPSSPLSSPNSRRRTKITNPLKFMRKHNDHVEMQPQECCSPKSKRAFEPTHSGSEDIDLQCTSFRQMDIGTIEGIDEET